ncbi:putative E3 ubiquitin-protein ligase LIN [Punica granatum]|uniref:E3 ubiquitin-protein ligase LIN n=1 Tax=Punica granatum TaxID=22663 RepID=A0A6P8E9Z3_PUNGR|nr:putative E3 ubiquitin-protein ligase LIN [Punica granatum]
MSSLQQLLAEDMFEDAKISKHWVKLKQMTGSRDEASLPIYICRDARSVSERRQPRPGRRRSSSCSERLELAQVALDSTPSRRDHRPQEAAVDEVAIKAVVSILGGYIGQYLRDQGFRATIREKCSSCLGRNRTEEIDHKGIFANLESGIESIENLVACSGSDQGAGKELRMNTLRNAIRLLNIVASLNSKDSVNSMTCGIPNSYLSACAQLYLSVVYKIEKNNRISAKHLLQVFIDSPFLARAHLLPDLWEHLFLPHLLHIKVWYSREVEFLSGSISPKKDKRAKELGRVYNNQMDVGTAHFALYYKQWLKVGAEAPPVPDVPVPSGPMYRRSRRKSSDSYSSIDKNLYQAVFGAKHDRRRSMDPELLREQNSNRKGELEGDWKGSTNAESYNYSSCDHNGSSSRSRSVKHSNPQPELWLETQRSNYFPFFPCQSLPMECSVSGNLSSSNDQIRHDESHGGLSSNLGRAILTICSSNDLTECEISVQVIAKARLSSNGDPVIEASVSRAPVVKGMVEVLFASEDDAVLELAISLLAETVAKDKTNAHIILNSDPQLEVFLRLLQRTSVFLKAAVLLYLLKPRSKQMISTEWIPLVLRVLEFGDQSQTLFTVRCAPRAAALYLLNQLLLGFDEDKSMENALEVVSLGGLGLLIRRIEAGDFQDRSNAALITLCCIRADGSCRNYVEENLNRASLLDLIQLEFNTNSRSALNLLAELLCLNRTRQIKLLEEIKSGAGVLNIMHILLIHLMKASPQERPIIAVVLLQIDLLGDLTKCSIFREEAVEAITETLDCRYCNEKVQEKAARALLMLAGHFTSKGEASAEQWLLQQSGFHEYSGDAFHSKDPVHENGTHLSEGKEEESKRWLGRTATVLLRSGHKRFLTALSSSIDNGIPVLARASLVTLSWLSVYLPCMEDKDLKSTACSIFVPQMLESINYDRALEERVLASLSLLNLAKSSGLLNLLFALTEESMSHLRNLSLVTRTASELISIITTGSKRQ